MFRTKNHALSREKEEELECSNKRLRMYDMPISRQAMRAALTLRGVAKLHTSEIARHLKINYWVKYQGPTTKLLLLMKKWKLILISMRRWKS